MGTPLEPFAYDEPPRRGLLALAVAVFAAGLALTLIGTAPSVTSTFTMRRVVGKPVAVVKPAAVKAGCPGLNNPGGKLDWSPVPNPGPTPTNGTVALPALGVSAPIVRVGIDSSSRMVVPKNAREVAWLDQGGIPGRTKNVVLAGHISYSRVAGSFFRLAQLKPGHDVVLDIGGKQLRYRVVWNCSFHRDTDLAAQIMGYTPVPSVTLISCGGVFDTAARTHTNRIAVRAELVTSA